MQAEQLLEPVLDGLGFPEGPVLLPDGRLAFVELRGQCVGLVEDGAKRELARLPGAPNGARLGPDGALYVANNGGVAPLDTERLWTAPDPLDGCIHRVTLDERVSVVVRDLPGAPPHRPNDLCFGPGGRLYFTDPGNWEVLPDRSRYAGGRLFRAMPGGAAELLADVPDFPNGLAIAPGGRELVVAQTEARRLLTFPLSTDGDIGKPDVFCDLPDVAPDGIAFADDGSLFVAGSSADNIAVVGADRRLERLVDTGPESDPTNLCLDDRGRLWVTLGYPGRIVHTDVGRRPLPDQA
jgi:gluconolactonase